MNPHVSLQPQRRRENHFSRKSDEPVLDTKGRALVVDDEESIRELVSMLLSHAGYGVDIAGCGFEAMARYRQKHFDVVITDLDMPHGNGRELTDIIKIISPDTPVILITGNYDMELVGEDAPFDAVLYKPFTVGQLLHAVYGVCRNCDAQRMTIGGGSGGKLQNSDRSEG